MMSRRIFSGLLLLAALLITLPLVAGFLGRFHPAFDSFAHFRLHLAALIAMVSVLLCLFRYWMHVLVGLLLACGAYASALGVTGTNIGPLYATIEPKPLTAKTFKLIQINVFYRNESPEQVVDLLKAEKPDFVTLDEVSDRWSDSLKAVLNDLPYQAKCGRGRPEGGSVILSRLPFSISRFTECFGDGEMARASFDIGDKVFDIVAIHLDWPWPFKQHEQISVETPMLRATGADALIAGDLNAAPWSNLVARLALILEAAPIRPVGGTWVFSQLPDKVRRTIGLPIDNVFAKGATSIHSVRLGPNVGSDHLPIIVEFSINTDSGSDGDVVTAAR